MCVFFYRILHSTRAGSPLTAVELLADGTTLMIGSSQGKVSLYDFRNMEFPVKSSKVHSSAVRCIKLQTVRGKLQVSILYLQSHCSSVIGIVSSFVSVKFSSCCQCLIVNVTGATSCKASLRPFNFYVCK